MIKWNDCFSSGFVQPSFSQSYTPSAHCQHTHSCILDARQAFSIICVSQRDGKKERHQLSACICAPLQPKFVESVDWNYCHSSIPYGIISFSLIFMILTLYKIAGQLCCGVPLSVFPHNSMRAVHLWQECHGSNVRFFLLHFIKWLLISPDFCILKLLIFPLQLAFCGEKL